MGGVCAGTGSQFRLLGCRTPQPSEGVSPCRTGCSRLFVFLAWVIFGPVELRGGFLGAHGYRNSPHLTGRRKKCAKGFLTEKNDLRRKPKESCSKVADVLLCSRFRNDVTRYSACTAYLLASANSDGCASHRRTRLLVRGVDGIAGPRICPSVAFLLFTDYSQHSVAGSIDIQVRLIYQRWLCRDFTKGWLSVLVR